VRLIDLTFLILGLNALIDGGGVVSMEEAKDHIREGDVLEWLKLKFPELDISTLVGPDRTGGAEIVEGLQGLLGGYAGDERRKWGLQNNGLNLLLGWTNELVQLGALDADNPMTWDPNSHFIPASDRVVALSHNNPLYQEMIAAIGRVEVAVRETNNLPEVIDRERVLAELNAGLTLLRAPSVRVSVVRDMLIPTLRLIGACAGTVALGVLGNAAWSAIQAYFAAH
jgi:hypothetical protein